MERLLQLFVRYVDMHLEMRRLDRLLENLEISYFRKVTKVK